MKILILNGPNLNLLGQRDPKIYGNETLDDIKNACIAGAEELDHSVDFRQSNYEGELVTWIQEAINGYDAIIINAGAYTHTSVALHDALELFNGKIVEVHISEPMKREAFRHISYIEPCANHRIAGQGAKGYNIAIKWLHENQ